MDEEDLARGLHEVPFCVVDVETSGTDAGRHRITEVAVARVVGGERVATLSTLVGGPFCGEPTMDELVPTLAEVLRGGVVVGHNVGFDLRFLDAAFTAAGHPPLWARDAVDTMILARRLLRGDEHHERRCDLAALAERHGLRHRPTHRALADVQATVELFHLLLERAAGYGVLTLDDLLRFPSLAAHPMAAKLALTRHLPRAPGTYRCLGQRGDLLHEGASSDVRRSVRHLFSGVDRRRIDPVLRRLARVTHRPH